jgi:VanZ family protein
MEPPAHTAAVPDPWHRRLLRWAYRWRHGLGLLAVLAVFAISTIPNTHPPRVRGLDKAQHIVEYFLLGLVLLNLATRGFTRVQLRRAALAWLGLVGISLLDETWQRWVPGRSFDRWDVAASAAGGLAAVGLVLVGHALASWRRG